MGFASHFGTLFVGTIVGLLPVINPLAAAPTFLAITEGDSAQRRLEQLRKACIYMVAILAAFLIGGTFIMSFFGISIPGMRIAGGLLVAGIGWRMLMEPLQPVEHANAEAKAKPDISFSPLAMPMLSGPGSIAVTLGFTSLAHRWWDYLAIVLGIVAVAAISYLTLRAAAKIVRRIGGNGLAALTRIMGFLLVCVGVQFVVNGITTLIVGPEISRMVHTLR